MSQVTEEQIKEHNKEYPLDLWTGFKYTNIEFERMTARLFNDKIIEWGVLYVTYFKQDGGETSSEQWFAIEVMNVDYRNAEFRSFDLRAYETLEKASHDTVVDSKIFNLAFLHDGRYINESI